MKSRGENLEKHYDQLFDPVERLLLRDLPQSGAALAFLLLTPQKPIFANNRVEVTRKAADIFARVFRQITTRGQDRAQSFILQLLVCVLCLDICKATC